MASCSARRLFGVESSVLAKLGQLLRVAHGGWKAASERVEQHRLVRRALAVLPREEEILTSEVQLLL